MCCFPEFSNCPFQNFTLDLVVPVIKYNKIQIITWNHILNSWESEEKVVTVNEKWMRLNNQIVEKKL